MIILLGVLGGAIWVIILSAPPSRRALRRSLRREETQKRHPLPSPNGNTERKRRSRWN